jgi:DnaJ-class molecular chaperone
MISDRACATCKGDGWREFGDEGEKPCGECGGRGYVRGYDYVPVILDCKFYNAAYAVPCDRCDGSCVREESG